MKERNDETRGGGLGAKQGGLAKPAFAPSASKIDKVEVETKGMKVEAKEGSVVVLSQENATSDDIEVSGAVGCTFYLTAKMAVLRLVNLKDCKVFCGPVKGSLYLEGAADSVVMAAAHQVRIHKATNVDFYLRTRSYPIIEKCADVKFAPYLFQFGGEGASKDALLEAKLEEENDLWSDVKDFGWLKSTPSPNWTILPEESRKPERFLG